MDWTLRYLGAAAYATLVGCAVMALLALWHGYRVEIGRPGGTVHVVWEQHPLRRFFVDRNADGDAVR